jgi:hypothetical protein
MDRLGHRREVSLKARPRASSIFKAAYFELARRPRGPLQSPIVCPTFDRQYSTIVGPTERIALRRLYGHARRRDTGGYDLIDGPVSARAQLGWPMALRIAAESESLARGKRVPHKPLAL